MPPLQRYNPSTRLPASPRKYPYTHTAAAAGFDLRTRASVRESVFKAVATSRLIGALCLRDRQVGRLLIVPCSCADRCCVVLTVFEGRIGNCIWYETLEFGFMALLSPCPSYLVTTFRGRCSDGHLLAPILICLDCWCVRSRTRPRSMRLSVLDMKRERE